MTRLHEVYRTSPSEVRPVIERPRLLAKTGIIAVPEVASDSELQDIMQIVKAPTLDQLKDLARFRAKNRDGENYKSDGGKNGKGFEPKDLKWAKRLPIRIEKVNEARRDTLAAMKKTDEDSSLSSRQRSENWKKLIRQRNRNWNKLQELIGCFKNAGITLDSSQMPQETMQMISQVLQVEPKEQDLDEKTELSAAGEKAGLNELLKKTVESDRSIGSRILGEFSEARRNIALSVGRKIIEVKQGRESERDEVEKNDVEPVVQIKEGSIDLTKPKGKIRGLFGAFASKVGQSVDKIRHRKEILVEQALVATLALNDVDIDNRVERLTVVPSDVSEGEFVNASEEIKDALVKSATNRWFKLGLTRESFTSRLALLKTRLPSIKIGKRRALAGNVLAVAALAAIAGSLSDSSPHAQVLSSQSNINSSDQNITMSFKPSEVVLHRLYVEHAENRVLVVGQSSDKKPSTKKNKSNVLSARDDYFKEVVTPQSSAGQDKKDLIEIAGIDKLPSSEILDTEIIVEEGDNIWSIVAKLVKDSENWENDKDKNGVKKADVVAGIFTNILRAKGGTPEILVTGTNFSLREGLDEEELQILKNALGTKSLEEYQNNVELEFIKMMTKLEGK